MLRRPAGWVASIWLLGILVGFIRLILGMRNLSHILANASHRSIRSLGQPVQDLLHHHRVDLFESPRIHSPVAIAIARRAVIVPAGFLDRFDAQSIDRALLHEVGHIIRRDHYWLLVQRLLGILLWPHLLVHLLNRAIDETREDVCDNLVLHHGCAVDYSRDLLQITQSLAINGPPILAPGLFTRRNLARRISGLLSQQRNPSFHLSRKQSLALALPLWLTCGGLAALGIGLQEPESHRYVTTETEGPFEPMFRSVELVRTCPANLKIQIADPGETWYGQLRYGSEGSTRVGFVVSYDTQGDFELFVDQDRDREITQQELVAGTGPQRRLELPTEITDRSTADQDSIRHFNRTVAFRESYSRDRLGFATLGYMEGTLDLVAGDQLQQVVVRRVDASGNGLFNDSADRIWIDANRDGQWDPVTELFSPQTIYRTQPNTLRRQSESIRNSISAGFQF